MLALSIRGLVMGVALLGTSIVAVNVEAMGCRQGSYATAPMGPPAAMDMMPYGMPGGYGYAPPAMYGYGGPMMAYRGYGQTAPMALQKYGYAPPVETGQPKASASAASEGEVNISQMRFEPAVIGIKAGETVSWRNGAGMPHTVSGRSDGGPNSGTLGSGEVFSHTFNESGTYEYYCALHPGMTGKVIVQ